MVSEPNRRGRIAYWGYVESEDRYLKVIVEADGEEAVTARFDRDFKRKMRSQR